MPSFIPSTKYFIFFFKLATWFNFGWFYHTLGTLIIYSRTFPCYPQMAVVSNTLITSSSSFSSYFVCHMHVIVSNPVLDRGLRASNFDDVQCAYIQWGLCVGFTLVLDFVVADSSRKGFDSLKFQWWTMSGFTIVEFMTIYSTINS